MSINLHISGQVLFMLHYAVKLNIETLEEMWYIIVTEEKTAKEEEKWSLLS